MESVSREKMKEVENFTVNEYGISEELLMEQAGFQVAEVVRQQFSENLKIGVVCGKGSNGGDGFVAARRLISWGYNIEVYTPFEDEELSETALKKLENIRRIDPDVEMIDFPTANAYVDALLGYGIDGAPRGEVAEAVGKLEEWSADTVSVDIPTGVDPDTGEGFDPHVNPEFTVMLGLPKKGLSRENSGKLYLADVGIPVSAVREKNVEAPGFRGESLIDLESDRF